MTRQVTDQLYIELDYYYPEEYYVYVAEALSAQSANVSLSCSASKITQAQASIVVTTTIIVTISHLEGADLFAFSESQLAAQVDRIRNNNIDTSTVFTVSSEVSRIRSLAADQITNSNIAIINERSRIFELQTQAAFSLTAETSSIEIASANLNLTTNLISLESIIKGFVVELQTSSIVSIDIARIRQFDVAQSAFAIVLAQPEIIRLAIANLTAANELSCVISHIEGADLQAFGESQLSVIADKIISANITVVGESAQIADVERIRDVSSDLTASSQISITISVIRNISATVISQSQQTVSESRVRSAVSSMISQTQQSVINDRVRSNIVSLAVTTAFTATISHIEGADLIAFSDAAVTATVNIIANGQSTQSATSVISVGNIRIRPAVSNIQSTTTLSALTRVLTRTTSYAENSGGYLSTPSIDTAIKKWGLGSLTWTQPSAEPTAASNIVWNGSSFFTFANGYTWSSPDAITWTRSSNNLSNCQFSTANPVSYQNGYFLFFDTHSDTLKYSSNATTWSDSTLTDSVWSGSGFNTQDRTIYYGAGYYHIIGRRIQGTTHRLTSYRSTSLTGSWARYDISNLIGDANLSGSSSVSDIYISGSTAYVTVNFFDGFPIYYGYVFAYQGTTEPTGTWTAISAVANRVLSESASNGTDFLGYVTDISTSNRYIYWKTSSSSGSYQFDHTVTDITYANSVWFISTNDGVYASSTVNGTFTLVDATVNSTVQYQSSRYVAYNGSLRNSVRTSSDYSTWSNSALSPIVSSGNLTYTKGDGSDLGNFKTIDFWIYSRPQGQQWIFEQSTSRYISFYTNTDGAVTVYNVNGASNSNLTASSSSLADSAWNHVRISVDSSTASLYVNGTRASTTNSWLGAVSSTFKVSASADDSFTGFSQGKLDEILISDRLISSPSLSSITVPSAEWYNDYDTDLLLHFNSDFADDAVYFVDPSATITALFAIGIDAVKIASAMVAINSESLITAQAAKNSEITLTAFSDAQVSTTVDRIRGIESTQINNIDLSAANTRVRDTGAGLANETTQSTTAVITAEANVNVSGVTIQVTAAVSNLTTDIDLAVTTAMSTVAVKTTDIAANLQSQSTVTANGIIEISFEAALSSTVAVSNLGERLRYSEMQAVSQTAQTATVNYIADNQSDMDSEFAADITTSGIIGFVISMSVDSQLVAVSLRKRDNQVTAQAQSVVTTTTNDSKIAGIESDIAVTTDLSYSIERILQFESDFDSISINVTAAAKIGSALVDSAMQSTLTAAVNVTAYGLIDLVNTSAVTAVAVKTTTTTAVIDTRFTQIAEGTTNITGEVQAGSTTALSAEYGVSYSMAADIESTSTVSVTASVLRGFAVLEQSSGTLTTTPNRIRSASAAIAGITIELVLGTKVISARATLSASSTLTAEGRDIDLAKYVYIIPLENRTWTIAEENRTRAIKEETRTYIIRRF